MELQGDVGHVESYFGSVGDGVNVGVRLVHGLRHHTIGPSIILVTPDGTLG
jgi:hypothetical protein